MKREKNWLMAALTACLLIVGVASAGNNPPAWDFGNLPEGAIEVSARTTTTAPTWDFGNLPPALPSWSFDFASIPPDWAFTALVGVTVDRQRGKTSAKCGCETGGECTCAECACCNEADYAAAYATAMKTRQSIYVLVGQDDAAKREYRRRAVVDNALFVAVASEADEPKQAVGVHQFGPPIPAATATASVETLTVLPAYSACAGGSCASGYCGR